MSLLHVHARYTLPPAEGRIPCCSSKAIACCFTGLWLRCQFERRRLIRLMRQMNDWIASMKYLRGGIPLFERSERQSTSGACSSRARSLFANSASFRFLRVVRFGLSLVFVVYLLGYIHLVCTRSRFRRSTINGRIVVGCNSLDVFCCVEALFR